MKVVTCLLPGCYGVARPAIGSARRERVLVQKLRPRGVECTAGEIRPTLRTGIQAVALQLLAERLAVNAEELGRSRFVPLDAI